jgi:hypothetical protein
LVVEGDGGGEGQEALQDALSDAGEGSGAVALEGEDVLAGPEDALDPLADRREVWPWPGSSLRRGRTIVARSSTALFANSLPA